MTNYTAPRTWIPGETPTDAMLNAQIRDNEIELMKSVGVFGHNFSGSPAAGGVIPFRMQCGSNVVTSDPAGLATVTFPIAFPGICMTVILTNGDSSSNGDLTFATNGIFQSYFGYGTFRSGGLVATQTHRINWLAIGW